MKRFISFLIDYVSIFEHMLKLAIDHKSKMPLHMQVESLLRELIEQPEYKNGAFLPKEVELANRLGVSRNTIRQATNKLENEGLLIRKKAVGTTVAPPQKLNSGLANWHSFTKEMMSKGIFVENLFIKSERVPANEKLGKFFKVETGTLLYKLSKLKGVELDPFVYFESYFHPRIELNEKDDLSKPIYDLLEDKYGIVVVRSNENINAKIAGEMSELLKLDPNSPILFRERYVYDPGDRPVEYNVGYYRSDRFTYSIELASS